MIDTQEAVVIKAQVPGMRKEQLQVTFSEGSLTIKGERREDEDVAEKSYMRREFRYGPFSRTIPLPAALQVDKATAQLRDGLLQITIPKSAPTRVTNIPIDG
jgi:HSP20 family protein